MESRISPQSYSKWGYPKERLLFCNPEKVVLQDHLSRQGNPTGKQTFPRVGKQKFPDRYPMPGKTTFIEGFPGENKVRFPFSPNFLVKMEIISDSTPETLQLCLSSRDQDSDSTLFPKLVPGSFHVRLGFLASGRSTEISPALAQRTI